jgi:sugar/nucleoside kinase (ribokinase family)
MTAGQQGSWTWDGLTLTHFPALRVPVASTAGAGDAHLAGILTGLATGLTLSEAQELATLVAACSVTSPHTIHFGLDRKALVALANAIQAPLQASIRTALEY